MILNKTGCQMQLFLIQVAQHNSLENSRGKQSQTVRANYKAAAYISMCDSEAVQQNQALSTENFRVHNKQVPVTLYK